MTISVYREKVTHNETFQGLMARAVEIQEHSGKLGLVKGAFRLLFSPVYKKEPYFLYEYKIKTEHEISEKTPTISKDILAFKVVTSNQEAEKLEAEGYRFRSHKTSFNHGLTIYTKWLDYGAVACCTFVGKEFAAIHWVILSENVQKKITFPIHIDYSNHIGMTRGAWVKPKFRGSGLFRYNSRNRDRFLLEHGVNVLRSPVEYTNNVGQGLYKALGGRKYGKARQLKILWWKSWKEYHFPS